MTDFNFVILSSYMLSGYKFMAYHRFEHFAIVAPCLAESEVGENAYIIPINDEQVFEMANGINEFSFYVLL